MDEIVKDVNEGWNEKDPSRPTGMQYVITPLRCSSVADAPVTFRFKGSDDYLRTKVSLQAACQQQNELIIMPSLTNTSRPRLRL